MTHIIGTAATRSGSAVTTWAGGGATITPTTDNWNMQDLLCIQKDVYTNYAQWRSIRPSSDSVYTMSPVASGDVDQILYGSRFWAASTGGASLAFVLKQDSLHYLLLGGRCTSAVAEWKLGGFWTLKMTFQGDSRALTTTATKTSLASAVPAASTPLISLRSLVYLSALATAQVAVKSVSIDFGITAAVVDATEGLNGRADYLPVMTNPVITLQPLYTDEIAELRRTVEVGRCLISMGRGNLSGGAINSMAFHAEAVYAMEADAQDDGGWIRNGLKLQVCDPGIFTGTTLGKLFQVARA
jgi:hypothetical protein